MNIDIFDEIDCIVNIDIKQRGSRKLYKAARKEKPLCYEAANIVLKAMEKGKNVIISSGFPILPDGLPETDGLLGAIRMANVFQTLKMKVIIVTDRANIVVFEKLAKKFLKFPPDFVIVPEDFERAKKESIELIKNKSPCLLISIEKPGINKEGKYCDMKGNDITNFVGKADFLFNEAFRKGIATIGIGDGGNEIGMGNIFNEIQSSIASVTKTNALIVSAVSNWGAYGLIAALSILMNKNFCHRGKDEEEMIKACVKAGAIDGVTKKAAYSVDGIEMAIHTAIVDLLYYICKLKNK